jgi:aryl-alcohol dehydrogenase-like predicted oxidoreductase
MGTSGFYGETDWGATIDTIHRALDLGVTFIDTATHTARATTRSAG